MPCYSVLESGDEGFLRECIVMLSCTTILSSGIVQLMPQTLIPGQGASVDPKPTLINVREVSGILRGKDWTIGLQNYKSVSHHLERHTSSMPTPCKARGEQRI